MKDLLSILRLYYSGRMTLDQLSTAHECDAPALIAAHEALPEDEQRAIMAQADALRVVVVGSLPPDDPIFSGGLETFSVRKPPPKDAKPTENAKLQREKAEHRMVIHRKWLAINQPQLPQEKE